MKRFLLPFFICAALVGCADINQQNSFEEAIKQPVFKVIPSGTDLSKKHEALTLVVSCIDFRLRDETYDLIENILSLKDQYDEVVFPGASIALVQTKNAHWSKTLEDFISISQKLHHVKDVIFVDHRDCGAYKLLKGEDQVNTKEKETEAHKAVFQEVRQFFKEKFPNIRVHTLLMGLDGVVENFS